MLPTDLWGRVYGDGGEEEKSRQYFRSTKALWNLSSVAGLTSAPSFADPARAHEQRGQAEDEAIERGEIRRALPGAITDEQADA